MSSKEAASPPTERKLVCSKMVSQGLKHSMAMVIGQLGTQTWLWWLVQETWSILVYSERISELAQEVPTKESILYHLKRGLLLVWSHGQPQNETQGWNQCNWRQSGKGGGSQVLKTWFESLMCVCLQSTLDSSVTIPPNLSFMLKLVWTRLFCFSYNYNFEFLKQRGSTLLKSQKENGILENISNIIHLRFALTAEFLGYFY
jgi:hypothetical protein